MNDKRQSFFKNLDYFTLILYIVLVAMGWFTIYAASYDMQGTSLFDISGRTGSQLMWMGISAVFIIVILLTDDILIKSSSPFIYGGLILLLIATIFLAPNIKGSHSWLPLGPFNIQPAEFAKIGTSMMMAYWCSRYEFSIKNRRDLLVSLAIFLAPMLIIILQNETGSALVFLTFLIVLYREGLTGSIILYGVFVTVLAVLSLRFAGVMFGATDADRLIAFGFIFVCTYLAIELFGRSKWHRPAFLISALVPLLGFVIADFFVASVDYSWAAVASFVLFIVYLIVALLIFRGRHLGLILAFGLSSVAIYSGIEYFFDNVLQPHQQNRIMVSLGLKDDPLGVGYNVNQSVIAIGSGGLTGKGFLNGTQTKLKYVPEQDTDFIFCTVGEESGFIGSTLVLSIFLALLLRLIVLAERQSDAYSRIFGYSVAAIIFFHLTINIGMVIGLTPVIGIPLPYFSYGGSSLLSFTVLLFVFLRLDASRKE